MPKKAILVTCLLLLVVHELMTEFFFPALMLTCASVSRKLMVLKVFVHLASKLFGLLCLLDLLLNVPALFLRLPVVMQR